MKYGFYVHYRADGIPFYVGKGSKKRAHHLKRRFETNPYHHRIVKKDGEENIKVLWTKCETEEESFRKEISLIALYRAMGIKLANMTDGGEGAAGWKPSEETRAKMRNKIITPETREKIRQAMIGRIITSEHRERIRIAHLGKKKSPHTEEHKEKIRETCRLKCGHAVSEETRAKLRAANLGKKHTSESKAKMSETLKGRKFTEEHKRKIGEAHKGKKLSAENRKKLSKENNPRWKVKIPHTCVRCGKVYMWYNQFSKWCSSTCCTYAYRERKKINEQCNIPNIDRISVSSNEGSSVEH